MRAWPMREWLMHVWLMAYACMAYGLLWRFYSCTGLNNEEFLQTQEFEFNFSVHNLS